jgi:Type IV secretion system pilin
MIKKVLLYLLLLTFAVVYTAPAPVYAQAWAANCLDNGVASLRCIPYVFNNIVNAALVFVGSVAVVLLIFAGIRFITSGGDPKQVKSAQQLITYAIIGLVIVLCSFGIIYFISYLTGAKCITNFGFTGCG